MWALGHHLVLGLALAALGGAALRVASLAAPAGLERVLAAAALGATGAGLSSLGLGLLGAGGEPLPLAGLAVAAWLATRRWVAVPVRRPGAELRAWWSARSPAQRAAAGALGGFGAAWVAWMLRYPDIGDDGLHYHLPQVVAWVQEGHPGSLHAVLPLIPVQNYPVTNEVLLAWLVGLAHSFTVVGVYAAATGLLLALSAWTGLRRLHVPPGAAGLATAALASSPICVIQLNGAYTDLPALAWLVCAIALCAAAPARPALLAPALLAAGLAVGTKTTAALPAAVALGWAAWTVERGAPGTLRRLGWPLGLTAGAALVVGGTWYVRNLVQHGSPLWPFVSAPWGDPLPPFLERFDTTFLSRPRATLEGRLDRYYDALAGDIVLLAGFPLAALLARTRAVNAAALVAAGLLLAWALAPFTGVTGNSLFDPVALTTTRYLLPTVVAAALALALAARAGGPAGQVATGLLALAVVLNVVQDASLGFPVFPSLAKTALALGAGGAVGLLAGPRAGALVPAGLAAGLAVLVAAGALSLAAGGYADRHADVGHPDADLVRWFAARPGFATGSEPVAQTPTTLAVLAGDRVRHPVPRIPGGEPCSALRARARAGWVVVVDTPFAALERESARVDACLRAVDRPVFASGLYRVYGGPS